MHRQPISPRPTMVRANAYLRRGGGTSAHWAFGERRLTFPDLIPPNIVAGAIGRLQEGHRLLRSDLVGIEDKQLDQPRLTNWGEEWPSWRIFWAMIDHDQHHGAEIGCLRDLYRASRQEGTPGAKAT